MKRVLFIDRDGTLVEEPEDFQVDRLDKIRFVKDVFPGLLALKKAGFRFVMVTNQDGLGTDSFPQEDFELAHNFILQSFSSQGIEFDEVLVCPHFAEDQCLCRKPHLGLVRPYLTNKSLDLKNSWVIGDRASDLQLGENMGVSALKIDKDSGWSPLVEEILSQPRQGTVTRKTKETDIQVRVNLDGKGHCQISTGIGFFDHMLEQLSQHGGFDLELKCQGDLEVDEHHTVEDVALALGEAWREALSDKVGIARYGFVLPMDEAEVQVSLDLSGRPCFKMNGKYPEVKVGELSTEMVEHFFHSFAQALGATLHMHVKGENSHHMVEASFKALARSLRQATAKTDSGIPSTKGAL